MFLKKYAKSDNKKCGIKNCGVFRSFFTGEKIIIILIDLEYYKNNKIPLEKMKEDINNGIKLIQESFKSEISLNTYNQIEDKIISFTYSYIELLKEMIKANMAKVIIQEKKFIFDIINKDFYDYENLGKESFLRKIQELLYFFCDLKLFIESHFLFLFLCLK